LNPLPSLLAFSFTLQTAIIHNCITDPSHNSEPPLRLHTHSVQPSCKSLSATPHSKTHKTSHAEVKKRQPPQKQTIQLTHNLISLISDVQKLM
jgi:hypothetical protein